MNWDLRPYDEDLWNFVSLISFFMAAFGGLIILVLPKREQNRRTMGGILFAAGLALLTFSFLVQNPEVLDSAREHIAITVVGMVIASISILRIIKRRD